MESLVLPQPRRAHLVGIAGNGMRALADVLLGWGWRLSGSDLDVAPVQSLAAAGVRLFQGHDAGNLPDEADEVVYSDAVPADNPELRRAAERGIPRVELLPDARSARRRPSHRGRGRHARKIDRHGHGRPSVGPRRRRSDGRLRRHAAGRDLRRTRRPRAT